MPCVRRFLCEIEATVRTSDSYNPQPSQNLEDRHPEEEIDVEVVDPLSELYMEAIQALFGHDKPSTPDKTAKAMRAIESLTGESCERAYKLCHGRSDIFI